MIVFYTCNLYNSIHHLYFNENKLRNFKKTRCAPHRPKGEDGRETRSSFRTCRKEIGKKLQNCQWAGAGAGGGQSASLAGFFHGPGWLLPYAASHPKAITSRDWVRLVLPVCLVLRATECFPGALAEPPFTLHYPELHQNPVPEATTGLI